MKKEARERIMNKKHEALRRLGIEPPKNPEENRRRAKAAHHGNPE